MPSSERLLPRYYQLKQTLESRLKAGEFEVGGQFPTDEELCRQYDLSRGTVRRALDMLAEEGWLRREQGRGTFVTTPQLAPVVFRLANFSDDMRARGLEPSTRLLQLRVIAAQGEVAHQLQLCTGAEVIEIARLRLADGKPMAYERRYLARSLCPELLEEDLEHESIHSLMIDMYNLPLLRACHTIEARALTEHEAELLEVSPGLAGFYISRVTYTTDDRPVTWYRIVYRGDQYHFTAEF